MKGFVAQAVPMEPKLKAEDAPKEQYANLKAQCTYLLAEAVNRLAEAVNRHRVAVALDQVELPPDMTVTQFREMLIEDLEQMKRKDADKEGN